MAHMFVTTAVTVRGVAHVSAAPILRRALGNVACILVALALTTARLGAQTSPHRDPAAAQDDPTLRIEMPTVTVTAQKLEEDKQKIPVSVTAVAKDAIEGAGVHIVSDAATLAPNTYFTEWSARKLSNARSAGSARARPNNPGITTYIDGVPQLMPTPMPTPSARTRTHWSTSGLPPSTGC
jgi:outer membrane receptor protein involved in Fe transport